MGLVLITLVRQLVVPSEAVAARLNLEGLLKEGEDRRRARQKRDPCPLSIIPVARKVDPASPRTVTGPR